LHLFNLYKHRSVLGGSVTHLLSFSKKNLFEGGKKIQVCDRGWGLNNADQSTQDVFNDVSKYISIISMSLDAVVPRTTDNLDMSLRPVYHP
jgi:hypothetical protein